MVICEHCGAENPAGFRYCGACAAPLNDAADRGARKVVTVLFCDVEGSTALGEELDPEALHAILSRYFDAIARTIERHSGVVQKFVGDAVMAVFGVPRVHEDDALRAVRAAVEIRDQLPVVAADVGLSLRFRTGVNTGVVVTDEGKTLVLGDAVNVASRLETAAGPGEILIGEETLRLVRDAVEVEPVGSLMLKGKSEPVRAFRLLNLDPFAPGIAARSDIPLVDRVEELALLRTVWERTLAENACQLVTVLGSAGVGKSRLADELIGWLGDAATALRGRCLPYGEGITFWPIAEALTALGERAEEALAHLSRGGAATPEELFLEVRRLIESAAADRPVVLHIDDFQWAEPMLIDLLGHLVELSAGSPILVLCTARTELLEEHPHWSEGRSNAATIMLEPLGRDESEQLLAGIGSDLAPQTRAHVIATSEGNPLFLQEMVGLARDRAVPDVPPTIQAVLAARLERLSSGEREILSTGAIEGQVFHRSAIGALAEDRPMAEIESRLKELVRKDLIRPHPASVPGDEAFRFRHLLFRDAAYERLPKAARAELHSRYAGWLERSTVGFAEVDEIAGWHMEQAVGNQREIRRPIDRVLTRRAAEHLYAAGRRAGDRSDVAAARNLLERALKLAGDWDDLRAVISVALAERLIEVGDLGRAGELLALADDGAKGYGARSLARLELLVYSRPGEGTQVIEGMLPRMLESLAQAGDERGLAKAHWLAFWVHWAANSATLAAEEARLSAEHARRGGDVGMWSRALGWYVATLLYGPESAATIARELDAIERQRPGPYLTACVELGRAEVSRLEGRIQSARERAGSALEQFRALGMRTMAATCDQTIASIELSAGEPARAVAALTRSDAILAEFGESAMRSTTQGLLARSHALLGATDSAAAAIELAEQLSAPQDVTNLALTDGARARLALAAGDDESAERWARSAVEHAERTDFVGFRAYALLDLAVVLSARGATGEARRHAGAALAAFEAKGDQPGAAEARPLAADIPGGDLRTGSFGTGG